MSKQTANSRSGGRIDQTQKIRISLAIALNIVQTSNRKSLLGLSVSKRLTTLTESVLGLGDSLKIRFLGAFRLRLSLDILDVSILQTFHAITESINGKTIGISLGGISEVLFLARPKFSNTSVTLISVLDSLDLGPFRFNLLDLCSEFLRKSIRFSGRTNKFEEAISILNTFSLCDRLQTLSVGILGLRLNIFSLNTLQSGFAKR